MAYLSIKFFIWACALLSGFVFFLILLISARQKTDTGYISFLYTLVPGFVYVLIELLCILFLPAEASVLGVILDTSETLVFLCMGLSCVFFYRAQYNVYRIEQLRFFPFLIGITLINYPLAFINEFASTAIVYALLSHAGIATLTLLRVSNRLMPSGWAGVASAGLGLIYFPFFFIADLFHLEIPHITSIRPVRLQAYAVYYLLVCFILFASIAVSAYTDQKSRREKGYALSRRESEMARLLCSNMTAAEIAIALSVSPATVKTHTVHIYRKMDVHSREELRARMMSGGTDA